MARWLPAFMLGVMSFIVSSCDGTIDDRRSQGAQATEPGQTMDLRGGRGSGSGHVYVVCFYGENDHDRVARNKCDEAIRDCRARYGPNFCHVLRNPRREQVLGLPPEAVIIVVTHTTPNNMSPDGQPNADCQIDIWDSEVSPTDFRECGPTIWYGCYGAAVAGACENVIPLQDEPEVLDSRDPEIGCRLKATMLCLEEAIRNKTSTSPEAIGTCVTAKMRDLTDSGDAACPRSGGNGGGGRFSQ